MANWLWPTALLLAALFDPPAAQAGPSICNDTEALHQLAVSLRIDGRWVVQGWQPLIPGDCAEPVPAGYQGRFLYFRAKSPGYSFRDDSVRFCTAQGRFRIEHGSDCTAQGYAMQGFAKTVTAPAGPQVLLSTRSQSERREAAFATSEDGHDATEDQFHYAAEVVFQGCKQQKSPGAVTCSFVGGGMEFGAVGKVRISDPVFTFLLGLVRGTPLAIDGEIVTRFGSFAELELHSVTPRVPNRFDKMLQNMQGEWRSVQNPKDRFAISGAVRQVRYGGRQMTPEFVTIQQSCRGMGFTGDFLMAWDSQSGTKLCYQIDSLTRDGMTLTYLPRGTRLDYERLPGG
ncbi:DUF1036 domain-containing protein [Leisingera sp. HS039]|uniref:DUF1036 domain-containing protein n=1 Tax=unclassified Leisingera TaxID=2614906 RepID=UPI001070C46F|nr:MULTISPECIES: DUF1036 domain-containing protein [unclassified Leisingera]MBQ4824209.1 DUF1036 domain-containing protein [Leisingera sp. HS039]QBR36838.1 DUF1036 domain-containing protein [Leisingera sp. NJS201]